MKVFVVVLLLMVFFGKSQLISPKNEGQQSQGSLSKYLLQTSYGLSNSELKFMRIFIELGGIKFGRNKSAHADYLKDRLYGAYYGCWNVVIYLNSDFKHFSCFPENFGINFASAWFQSGYTLPFGFHYVIFKCNKYYLFDKEEIVKENFQKKGQGVTSLEEEVINNAISTASVIEKDNLFYNARYIYNSLFDTGEFWRVCIASENSKAILRYSSPLYAWIEYENYGLQKWHYSIWRDTQMK